MVLSAAVARYTHKICFALAALHDTLLRKVTLPSKAIFALGINCARVTLQQTNVRNVHKSGQTPLALSGNIVAVLAGVTKDTDVVLVEAVALAVHTVFVASTVI